MQGARRIVGALGGVILALAISSPYSALLSTSKDERGAVPLLTDYIVASGMMGWPGHRQHTRLGQDKGTCHCSGLACRGLSKSRARTYESGTEGRCPGSQCSGIHGCPETRRAPSWCGRYDELVKRWGCMALPLQRGCLPRIG